MHERINREIAAKTEGKTRTGREGSLSDGLNRDAQKIAMSRNAVREARDIPEITLRMLKGPP